MSYILLLSASWGKLLLAWNSGCWKFVSQLLNSVHIFQPQFHTMLIFFFFCLYHSISVKETVLPNRVTYMNKNRTTSMHDKCLNILYMPWNVRKILMIYVQNEMNGKSEMYKLVCMVWQALNSLVIWVMQSGINLRATARLLTTWRL